MMRPLLAALALCAGVLTSSAQQTPHHKVWLVLTYVKPTNDPDIRVKFPKDSIEECWADAQKFVAHGIPDKLKDEVVATMAACLVFRADDADL